MSQTELRQRHCSRAILHKRFIMARTQNNSVLPSEEDPRELLNCIKVLKELSNHIVYLAELQRSVGSQSYDGSELRKAIDASTRICVEYVRDAKSSILGAAPGMGERASEQYQTYLLTLRVAVENVVRQLLRKQRLINSYPSLPQGKEKKSGGNSLLVRIRRIESTFHESTSTNSHVGMVDDVPTLNQHLEDLHVIYGEIREATDRLCRNRKNDSVDLDSESEIGSTVSIVNGLQEMEKPGICVSRLLCECFGPTHI